MSTESEKPALKNHDNNVLTSIFELMQEAQSEDQSGNAKELFEKAWLLLDQVIDINNGRIKDILEKTNLILLTPEFEAIKEELELASSRLQQAQIQMGVQMAALPDIDEDNLEFAESLCKALTTIDFSHNAQDMAVQKLQDLIDKNKD